MSRGNKFNSILEWFREGGSVDEVKAILPLCVDAAQARSEPPAKSARAKTSSTHRSAAAKRAWETRRLNAQETKSAKEAAA
jgi:hypothetical protein